MTATVSMALQAVLAEHVGTLAAAGVPSPEHDAAALAAHVLGRRPAELRARGRVPLGAPAATRLAELVAARARRVPLQHLTGEVGFRELTLACRPGVFVPRPETEVLAGAAVERARERSPGAVVLEPCTGTGAVALAVATEVPAVRVLAADCSPAAVELARANRARVLEGVAGVTGLAPAPSCEVLAGDLLAPFPSGLRGAVDVLVANPPYLDPATLAGCEPEVTEHDPSDALVGGPDGYEVLARLVAAAGDWLAPGGHLVVEIDDRRPADAVAFAVAAGLREVATVADLTGRPRVLVARAPGGGP